MWQAGADAAEVDDLEAYWVPDPDDREDDEMLDADDLEDEFCSICGSPYPCYCGDAE